MSIKNLTFMNLHIVPCPQIAICGHEIPNKRFFYRLIFYIFLNKKN